MKNSILNIFKLIGVMYVSISLKNLLQILIGTLTNYSEVAQVYRLVNLQKETSFENVIRLFYILLVYDYLIFTVLFYFWIFVILFFLTKKFGNKLWIQISYSLSIYLLAITYYDPFHYNILFILIAIFLGYANWWLFKKWINFD